MPRNVVLLGYGSIAQVHAGVLRRLQGTPQGRDLRLYGVMGRDPQATEAFAREWGMELATTDLERVLDDSSVDIVVICSPTDLHAEQAERSLRAGKHVLCEIPLATSLSQTDRLIRTVEETGRCLMVCHTQRFRRGFSEARRMIAAGEFHAHAVLGRHIRIRRQNENWTGRKRTWTDNLLWHPGCHCVDALLWLVGATEVEVAAQVALPGGNLEIPMDLTLAMRTPRDQILTAFLSFNSHFMLQDYLIIGEETSLSCGNDYLRRPDRVLVEQRESGLLEDPILLQDTEFLNAILEQREPAVSAREARPAMAALQAAQDSLDARLRQLGPDARHPDLP